MNQSFDKIVLINLPSPWLISDRDLPPMGLLYLAAALRAARVEVQIADLAGLPEEQWQIPEGDLYGVSLTTPQFPYAKRVIEILRTRTRNDVAIAAGGPHVSALPYQSLEDLDVDYTFMGEADDSLVALALGQPLETISGLTYKHDQESTCGNGVHSHVSVSALSLPARDLIDIRSYHKVATNNYVLSGARYEGYLQSGRGCAFECAFCAASAITNRKVRYRPINSVVYEAALLAEKYDCDLIYIEDDTFNLSHQHAMDLCTGLAGVGTPWHCLCRVDHLDRTLLWAMHNAGCQCITFGFESGSNRILSAMKKKATAEQGLRAAEMVHEAGMKVRGQMIVGFPGETDESVTATEHFVRTAAVDKWGFHAFVPLPGSDVWAHPERYGLSLEKSEVDFGDFQTIGKPRQWDNIHTEQPDATRVWLNHLIDLTQNRNIFVGVENG